jgi:hypothetical protein
MKKSIKTWLPIVVFSLIILPVVLSAACAASEPRELEIPVRMTAGQLYPAIIRVGQNDTVTLKIESDQPGSLHLHGYDLDHEVKSGEVTDLVFVADASGRFRIAFHLAGDDTTGHQEPGHDEVAEASHDDPGHQEEDGGPGHGHEEDGEVEEIEVGFLEVQPR